MQHDPHFKDHVLFYANILMADTLVVIAATNDWWWTGLLVNLLLIVNAGHRFCNTIQLHEQQRNHFSFLTEPTDVNFGGKVWRNSYEMD